MSTDILNPRELATFLELYGFEKCSYLALYLSTYELIQNKIIGVDEAILDEYIADEELMKEFCLTCVLCIGTESGAEALILRHDTLEVEVLILRPSDVSSVRGAAVFGTETILHHIQDLMGTPRGTSQRPLQ